MTKVKRPYGLWNSPLQVAHMSEAYRLYDAKWDTHSEALVWQERRRGGHALVVQQAGENPRDIIRDTGIGGGLLFGGGGFTVGRGWVYYAGKDNRLYALSLSGGVPQPLTPAYGRIASPALSPDGRWIIYVHAYEEQEALVIVPSDGSAYPRKLFDDTDFLMQPTWHPYGDRIAFVGWDHPHMPWNDSQLHLLHLSAEATPGVIGRQVVAGKQAGTSVFGAAFSPDSGYLAYTSDASGWWQLYLYDLDLNRHYHLTTDEAEYGLPGWLQDMRTFGWAPDGRSIYALRTQDTRYTLQRVHVPDGDMQAIENLAAYTHLEQLSVNPVSGEVAMIAGATHLPDRVITIQPGEAPRVRAHSSVGPLHSDYLVQAQDIHWQTQDGIEVHGLYYPPTNPKFKSGGLPPLIVYVHSGPTRQRFARYFPETHFFTTRGFSVLEANYRGSTGYGREFKNMLHGNWGVAEVEDVTSGAQHLVELGLANPDKIIIMGGSSGGFSVLQALIHRGDTYRAGIAQAPVTDQFGLSMNTHKFERYYNDVLLGTLPAAAAIYRERSPALHAARIQTPLALFHGTVDQVVPIDQSIRVASALRGAPHVFRQYDGEGHSFRQPETVTDYYQTILSFLMQHVIYA